MLTSAGTVVDRIVGLEVGQTITSPSRSIRANSWPGLQRLRRTSAAARGEIGADRVRIGRCVIDLGTRRLTHAAGADQSLTPLEFDLLKALVENPGRVLSREPILTLAPGTTGTRSIAASTCASCVCAARSSPIPSIHG